MSDERAEDAYEMLEDIHEAVVTNGSDSATPPDWPRFVPDRSDKAYTILTYLRDEAPATSREITGNAFDDENINTTRPLSALYFRGLVNRREITSGGEQSTYEYTGLTEWGRQVIAEAEEQPQLSDENDSTSEEEVPTSNPWDRVDISKQQWRVLAAIAEYKPGHPATNDLTEVLDMSINQISPKTTKLYQRGYLDRPPEQPYSYWLTEKGNETYQDGRGREE